MGANQLSSEEIAALRRAVEEADIRVLLMTVFQLSGDPGWLDYRPRRDVRLIADEDAGLSAAEQAAIRAAAVDLIARGAPPAIADPGDALMTRMMSVCIGQEIPREYATLMREELGFIPRDFAWSGVAPERRPRVLIVGAGLSGIALGVRLKRLGIDFTILERHDGVGGVWLENKYPGVGVDTPNHAFSYSFAPPHPWSRYFSPGGEIHGYLREIADSFGVLPHVRFSHTVRSARWDAQGRLWRVAVDAPGGSREETAPFLVSAIGQFGEPQTPSLPGAESFAGEAFHSVDWPKGFDARGRRIAVIGAGASAMQIVPSIAQEAERLTIHQRTPQWVRPAPRYHDKIGEGAQWLMRNVPLYAGWFRFTMWWRYGDELLPQLRRDPDWPHKERSVNRRNDRHREEMVDYIRTALRGRDDLIAKSIPDYPPFGKRILLDNGWYEAIRRPNVELVTEPIREIAPAGVVTADGVTRGCDVIVYATGFRLGAMASRLNITGRDGLRLSDVWAGDNPSAYLGIAAPGFPNLFMMGGPNTGLAHGGSTIFQAEAQARYISGMVVKMTEAGVEAAEVTQAAHDAFVAETDAAHAELVWTHPKVQIYYKNKSGRVFSAMPYRLADYWRMTHEPDLGVYLCEPRAG